LMSSMLALSFWSALQATVAKLKQEHSTIVEKAVVNLYRYVPMLSLAGMLSYLALQF
jgi:hypothetical protein